MEDRVPLYPGRVTLTPVSGQTNTYDMARADQPTVTGTPLNKANLLSDATAAKLDNVTTVDAALALLARLNGGLGNEYVWSKTKTEASLSLGSSTQFRTDYSVNLVITVYETAVANLDGTITLSESSTYRSNEHTGYHTDCAGKYYQYSGNIYCLTSVTSSTIEGKHYLDGSLVSVVVTNTNYGYVNSPSSDAYPPAVSDGYTYTALGQLGEKMQIATGSYTGTGTSDLNVSFDLKPYLLILSTSQYSSNPFWIFTRDGYIYGTSNNYACMMFGNYLTDNGLTMTNQESSLNRSGYLFKYTVIGY